MTVLKRRRKPSPRPRRRAHSAARPRIPVSKRDRLAGEWFAKLVALQARLRGPGGCPWDREQTSRSIRKYLLEETYEVLDAMDSADPRKFSGELGDLLLQVVFHANIATEAGLFTISDVIESVHGKMIRRHPHVFGDVQVRGSADVLKNWEHLKAEERAAERAGPGRGEGKKPADQLGSAGESLLSGVSRSLPAVLEAYQLTRRAARVGFDWDNLDDLFRKLDEEKRELESALSASGTLARNSGATRAPDPNLEEEIGDLLFVAVNIARFLGADPEIALKKANRKFQRRFQWMESAAAREGRRFADLPRERMEELWNQSKAHDAKDTQ
ncbi:MAG: nucleoside triphosphate pyrophosphohydrolase [Candidatus Acidiferrales bacterium]